MSWLLRSRASVALTGLGLASALTLLAEGCRAPAGIADQRPADVSREDLASTVWIASPTETGISGFASAVVLGPRTLLTNAHVWATADPWWSAELPARRKLALFNPATLWRVRLDGGVAEVELPARTVELEFRLLAAGVPATAGDRETDLAADWVLIETPTPGWDPVAAATPHPSAGDPAWRVPEGTELMVVGYSSLFGGEALQRAGDEEHADGGGDWEALAAFLVDGPYAVVGQSLELDGLPAVSYPADWPPPKGHSGGGVYVRADAPGRPQLVGVFHTCVPVRAEVSRRYAPLGLDALSFERRFEQDSQALVYSPLAPVLEAMRRAGR